MDLLPVGATNACKVEKFATFDNWHIIYISKTVQDRRIVFNCHFHTALQTTDKKSYIADEKILPFSITLSDLEILTHCKLLQVQFLYSLATVNKI